MRHRTCRPAGARWGAILLATGLAARLALPAFAQTEFTFQGHIKDGNRPGQGSYDLRFELFDAELFASQTGPTLQEPNFEITNGFVTVLVDFGDVFNGDARWLEIALRRRGVGDHTVLALPVKPTYKGNLYSTAWDINDHGQVVGNSSIASGMPHAFLWDGTMKDLGTLGGNVSFGKGVNNLGQVVGYSRIASGELHAYLWDGTMTDLGTLGGNESRANAINDVGQIVGISQIASGDYHAFLWDGSMTDLGTLGGVVSDAFGINNHGQVVGCSRIASGEIHAFLWDGTMTDLGTLGGSSSTARDINNLGQVVGYSEIASGGTHPFMWDGTMTDLGTLVGTSKCYGQAINDLGQVAGYGVKGSDILNPLPHYRWSAFLWDVVMTDLGTLGGEDSHALGINNLGQIVGYSSRPTGRERACLWDEGIIKSLGTLEGP